MKLLVTGGAGFIGSALIRAAIKRGHEIVNVDKLTYAANLGNIACVASNPNYSFEQVDICDAEALGQVFDKHGPEAVMHLAAESHVDRSIDAPSDFISTNIVGTYNLLSQARRYWDGLNSAGQDGFVFHHISTDEVYGDLSFDAPPFSETTRYDPSSPYSASKAASDHLVRAWGRTYGLPVVLSNCSNNYGPFQFPEKLIPVVILKALFGDAIPVYGSGENIRDWLYVDDHADALLCVLSKGKKNETYNIGGNSEMSNLDLVKTICALMDKRGVTPTPCAELISFVQDRPGHDLRYAVNADKIKSELGWIPSVSIEAGLEKTITWYLDNRDWWSPLMTQKIFGQRLGIGR